MILLIGSYNFLNPEWLIALAIIPLVGLWMWWNKKPYEPSMTVSDLSDFVDEESIRGKLRILLPILRTLAAIALIIALARPQLTLKEEEITAEGIDIAMVMDLSSSMLAQDFKPDRLAVSKRVADEFITKREHDRISLSVFAGEAFTQCPLTTDHEVVRQFLAELQCGLLEDGTAIGMGLASAINRLKDSAAKSKIVILLTDGVNNAGYIKPITAAEIAQEFDVKVYTIGVGSMGDALTPVSRRSDGQYIFGLSRVEIDEALLRQIADMTEGKYYRATSAEALQRIYDEIDVLEKTEIEITAIKRYSDEFYKFVGWGVLLLLIEVILRNTVLSILP